MNRYRLSSLAAVFTGLALTPLAAQQAAAAAPAGVRGEILGQFNEAVDKLVQLAEAIPQDKFTWRPAAGVRSVSEVFLHVAGSNDYMLTAVTADGHYATRVQVQVGRSAVNTIEIVRGLDVRDSVILSDMSQWDNVERVGIRR